LSNGAIQAKYFTELSWHSFDQLLLGLGNTLHTEMELEASTFPLRPNVAKVGAHDMYVHMLVPPRGSTCADRQARWIAGALVSPRSVETVTALSESMIPQTYCHFRNG
jgi:hypothetical protein